MVLYTIIILVIAIMLFINLYPAFGNRPSGELLTKIEISTNYVSGKFQNLILTDMRFEKGEDYYGKYVPDSTIGKTPKQPLPSIKFNKSAFVKINNNSATWLGHSNILLKLEEKIIVIDPTFNRASPFPYLIGPAPFKYENEITAKDLPDDIDYILITHDHYDHLDYKSIKYLDNRVRKYLVPLGVKAHLLRWGILDNKILEFDWYENSSLEDIDFIFTPARHFSGRAFRDRLATLWGGWIIKSQNTNIYISGDGGYSDEFNKIGENYGPFDVVFIENGAYNPRWQYIHLFPDQSVQASIESQAKLAVPIHWGKYNLSFHNWKEPIERFVLEAKRKGLPIATPIIGQTFIFGKEAPQENWWENLK